MNDVSRQTRSAVASAQQTEVAVLAGGCFWGVEDILRDVPPPAEEHGGAGEGAGRGVGQMERPITTSIEPASTWSSAEGYHQDYLKKHPGGYT